MIDKEWLEKRYVHDLTSVADMAMEAGCGTANAWKGGQQYCNGYGVSCLPDTGELIYTHRHVAEEIIGRKLSHDDMHHMDYNKLNNRPDNLLILSNSDHIKLHAAIAVGSVDVHTQVAWLKSHGIKFLEVKNESIERQAA